MVNSALKGHTHVWKVHAGVVYKQVGCSVTKIVITVLQLRYYINAVTYHVSDPTRQFRGHQPD